MPIISVLLWQKYEDQKFKASLGCNNTLFQGTKTNSSPDYSAASAKCSKKILIFKNYFSLVQLWVLILSGESSHDIFGVVTGIKLIVYQKVGIFF